MNDYQNNVSLRNCNKNELNEIEIEYSKEFQYLFEKKSKDLNVSKESILIGTYFTYRNICSNMQCECCLRW